jgi:hypothetical protein
MSTRIFHLGRGRCRTAFVCWTIGIVLVTYGLARWSVTYGLVQKDVGLLNDSHVRESADGNRLFKMIVTTGGDDMWMSGAIGCCAFGAALLFTAFYLRSTDSQACKTDESRRVTAAR